MTAIAKIVLDKRRPRKNNTFPLYLRIWYRRSNASIALGYTIPFDDWDEINEQVKKSCKQVENITRLNNHIAKKKAKAYDVITQLKDTGELENLSLKELKERILNENKSIPFYKYTEDIIKNLKSVKKYGNANAYISCKNAIKLFQNNVEIDFNQINYKFLSRFETYYLAKGNTINGLSFVMRTLRAIFNRAIKEGYARQENYPFKNYKIRNEPTRKRAIRIEDIHKIRDLKLSKGSDLWHAQNYYMASFYLMGISFSDLATLKMENIIDGRIEYRRHKTGRLYSIKIVDMLQKILDNYINDKEKQDYIFPIIQRPDDSQLIHRDIKNEIKKYNKNLKGIANKGEININLTSYTCRHSWATIAKRKGVPTAIISEGLGHTSEQTTQVYLDSFDKEVMDEYNEDIIS